MATAPVDPLEAALNAFNGPSLQAPSPGGSGSAPQQAPAKAPTGPVSPPQGTSSGVAAGGNAPAEKPGILQSIANGAKRLVDTSPKAISEDVDIAKGAVASVLPAVLRAPGQLVGGILDTSADANKFVGDNINAGLVRASTAVGLPGVAQAVQASQAQSDKVQAQAKAFMQKNLGGSSLADVLSLRQSLGQVGNPAINQFLTQAVATLGGGPEGVGAKMVAAGARAAVTADVPQEKAATGVPGMVAASMGASATEPTTAADRLLNRGVQGLVGGAAEGAITGAGALWNHFTGPSASQVSELIGQAVASKNAGKAVVEATPEEAVADRLGRDFATQRTQDARLKQLDPKAEPDAQEVVPPGRHADATSGAGPEQAAPTGNQGADQGTTAGDQGQSVSPSPLVTDANAALEKAGAAERIPDKITSVSISSAPYVHKGDLWKLSPDELDDLYTKTKANEDSAVERALGSPTAAATYKDLYRKSLNTYNHSAADEASAQLDAMEASWTPQQKRLIYGDSSAQGPSSEDIQAVQEGHQDFFPDDDPAHIALMTSYAVRRSSVPELMAAMKGQGSPEAQRNLVTILHGYKALQEAGIPSGQIPSKMVEAMVKNGAVSTERQAAELMSNFEESMNRPRTAQPSSNITAAGHLLVAGPTKDTLDEAGMGRGFIAADRESPPDPVLFKETAEDGSQRVIGETTQADLNGFLEDAKRYAADPTSINPTSEHGAGQWNLRPLGTSDDVSAMGRAFADRLPDRGVVTNEETLAAAKEMGFDSPTDAHILAGMMSSQTDGLAKGLTAGRLMASKINEDMASLTGTDWTSVPLDDPRWEKALASYHNGYSFMQAFRQAKSEVARTLQSMKLDPLRRAAGFKDEDLIPPQPVPDFETYRNAFGKTPPEGLTPVAPGTARPLPATPQEMQDALNLLDTANKSGADAVNAFWKGVSFHPDALKYLRTSLANWYTAGLVSRPTTFARDLIGPAVLSGFRTFEKSAGAPLGAAWYAAKGAVSYATGRSNANALTQAIQESVVGGTGSTVPDLLAQAMDAPKAYAQTMGDVVSSMKYAWNTVRTGESRLNGAQPYNFDAHGVPQAMIDSVSNGNPLQSGLFSLGNSINKLPQAIHNLHGGINELALRLSYLGEVRAAAMSEARDHWATYLTAPDKDAAKLQLQALDGSYGQEPNAQSFQDNYVKQRVMASEDPLYGGQATDLTALQSAQRTTFTKPVGDPSTQPIISSISNTLNALRTNVPELRYVMPIYTVPANNFGETLRRVPILGQLFRGTQQELSGAAGKVVQAEAYGRILSGAATLTAGYMLMRQGMMTGAGPAQAKDKATWEAEGFQPYSIKNPIDGKWYSYNRIDGLGSLLGIIANTHDDTIYHARDNPWAAPVAAVSGLAEYFKDQSNLQGVSELLDFGSNPSQDAGRFQQLLKGTASGFVPGFLQTARQWMDPEKRVTTTPGDAILNALPGASTRLDPVRNLFGDAVHVPGNALGVLPVTTGEVNPQGPPSQVLEELHRLFLKTGYQPGVLPPTIAGAGLDQRAVKLEDGHSLYDARMRYRAIVTNDDGQTLKQALADTINSEDYKNGFDGSARGVKLLADDPSEPDSRTAMIEKVFHQFDKQAKEQVAQGSPLASRYLASAAVKQQGTPAVQNHTTQDLATNDNLVKALGINMGDYIQKVQGSGL